MRDRVFRRGIKYRENHPWPLATRTKTGSLCVGADLITFESRHKQLVIHAESVHLIRKIGIVHGWVLIEWTSEDGGCEHAYFADLTQIAPFRRITGRGLFPAFRDAAGHHKRMHVVL